MVSTFICAFFKKKLSKGLVFVMKQVRPEFLPKQSP